MLVDLIYRVHNMIAGLDVVIDCINDEHRIKFVVNVFEIICNAPSYLIKHCFCFCNIVGIVSIVFWVGHNHLTCIISKNTPSSHTSWVSFTASTCFQFKFDRDSLFHFFFCSLFPFIISLLLCCFVSPLYLFPPFRLYFSSLFFPSLLKSLYLFKFSLH